MSLLNKTLQVIDVMDVLVKDKKTNKTMFSGVATKTGISNTNDKIDIYGGIGQQRVCSLKTKKTTTMEVSVAEFNLEYMAAVNGVAIDTESKGTYYLNKEFDVSGTSASIDGATRILAVRKLDGTFMKVVDTEPADANEVKVVGADLTFATGFSDTKVLVSFEGTAPEGKENLTIKFNSKSFPKAAEVLGTTIIFDSDTEEAVADLAVNYYSASIDGEYDWSFEMGKNIESVLKLEILVPKTLPDGSLNSDGDTGVMTITER